MCTYLENTVVELFVANVMVLEYKPEVCTDGTSFTLSMANISVPKAWMNTSKERPSGEKRYSPQPSFAALFSRYMAPANLNIARKLFFNVEHDWPVAVATIPMMRESASTFIPSIFFHMCRVHFFRKIDMNSIFLLYINK